MRNDPALASRKRGEPLVKRPRLGSRAFRAPDSFRILAPVVSLIGFVEARKLIRFCRQHPATLDGKAKDCRAEQRHAVRQSGKPVTIEPKGVRTSYVDRSWRLRPRHDANTRAQGDTQACRPVAQRRPGRFLPVTQRGRAFGPACLILRPIILSGNVPRTLR
mgnify:CR=1 FL=1